MQQFVTRMLLKAGQLHSSLWFVPLQVYCLFCCHATSQKQFSSLSDVTDALRKVNISLVNSRLNSPGAQRSDVTFAGVKVSLEFPWPLDKNGTMQLPSNQRLPIQDVRDFARQLWRQVGINGLLPPLQLFGLGNYGLSMETFLISFQAGNTSEVQITFNIPGWDALHQFKFKIVQPKLHIKLDFLRRKADVKAKGFLVSLNYVESKLKNRGLPFELTFPDNLNDTDECQYPNVCDPQASCNNYPGGFNCSCNIGWRGQGRHPMCSDIDECTEGIDR